MSSGWVNTPQSCQKALGCHEDEHGTRGRFIYWAFPITSKLDGIWKSCCQSEMPWQILKVFSVRFLGHIIWSGQFPLSFKMESCVHGHRHPNSYHCLNFGCQAGAVELPKSEDRAQLHPWLHESWRVERQLWHSSFENSFPVSDAHFHLLWETGQHRPRERKSITPLQRRICCQEGWGHGFSYTISVI